MPIEKPNKDTAPVFYPEDNYSVVKYLDIVKFLSLVQKEAIFFCRLDKMEDKFEGTLPEVNKEFYQKWFTEFAKPAGLSPSEIIDYVKDRLEVPEKFKKLNCISCWNKGDVESYALWKIYSEMDRGIMIKTTVDKLIESFSKSPENIQISEIKYIDHSTDFIPPENLNFPIIHKNLAYSYEQEIRLIHQVEIETGLTHNWDAEPISTGRYIKTDLNILIDEIILSPYCSKWFYEIIVDIMEKYGIKKPLKFSSLKR